MPASTITISAKNFARSRASTSTAETLRRLLREAGLGSPRKRRAPTHRQRRLRSPREGELLQLDGSPHDWLEGRGPRLTALGLQDDATGKILAAQFFPSESAAGYLTLLRQLLRHRGIPLAFYGDHSGIFVRNDDFCGRSKNELRWKTSAHSVRPCLYRTTRHHLYRRPQPASQRPRRTPLGRAPGSVVQRNSDWRRLPIWTPPTPSSACSWPTTTAAPPADLATCNPPGVRLRKISTASAASSTSAWSATTTSCSGTASAFRSPSKATLQLCRSQSPHLSSSRRARLALLRRHPPATHPGSARVTLSWYCLG